MRNLLKKQYMLIVVFMTINIFLSLELSKFDQIKLKLIHDNGFIEDSSSTFHINGNISGEILLDSIYSLNNIFIQQQFIPYNSFIGRAIYFGKEFSFSPELSWGRFFKNDDFKEANPLIVIGPDLESEVINVGNNKSIIINNTEYEVIGILKGDNSSINNVFYINLNYILNNTGVIDSSNYYSIAEDKLSKNLLDSLDEVLKSFDNNLSLLKDSSRTINNPINNYIKDRSFYLFLILLVFFISTINISNYYINFKKREIGILKALGIKDFTIFKKIILEYQLIAIFSFALGVLIHYCIYILFLKNSMYYYINIKNIVTLFFVSIIVGTLTCIYPLIKSKKICPNLLMKR